MPIQLWLNGPSPLIMNYQYSVLPVAIFALFGFSACGKCISKTSEQQPHQREHLPKVGEVDDTSARKGLAQSGSRAQEQPLTRSEIKHGIKDFSLRLYSKEGRRSDDDRNFVIAPMSVYLALGVARGAVAGESAGQMDQVLALPPQSDAKATAKAIAMFVAPSVGSAYNEWTQATAGLTWASATGFFAGKGLEFNPDFVRRVGVSLGVAAQNQPFTSGPARASRDINRWVRKETSDQIEGFLDSTALKPSTQLLLLSAIWFNGDWLESFDKKLTRPRPFFVKGNQRKVVPTMKLVESLRTLETSQFRAVSLPYDVSRLSMTIVVPKQESDLRVLESKLNVHELARSIERSLPQKTELTLPRLRIESPGRDPTLEIQPGRHV